MKSAVVPRTAGSFPHSMADFDLGMNLNLSLAVVAVVAILGLLTQCTASHPQLVARLLYPILFFTIAVGATSSHSQQLGSAQPLPLCWRWPRYAYGTGTETSAHQRPAAENDDRLAQLTGQPISARY